MECFGIDECFEQIGEYFSHETLGQTLVINTDQYDCYYDILSRLSADGSKEIVRIDDYLYGNGLPNFSRMIEKGSQAGNFVFVGLSQAAMLQSKDRLMELIHQMLSLPIKGHAIVLLEHSSGLLQECMARDLRLKHRILLLQGEMTKKPSLVILSESERELYPEAIPLKMLYAKLIELTDTSEKMISVVTDLKLSLFANSMYAVNTPQSPYARLVELYPELSINVPETAGKSMFWVKLLSDWKQYSSFSGIMSHYFGEHENDRNQLLNLERMADSYESWMFWLKLKTDNRWEGSYLGYVVNRSEAPNDLVRLIYVGLADILSEEVYFRRFYTERKKLIELLSGHNHYIQEYCQKIGIYQKQSLWYLSDETEQEQKEICDCLSKYSYTNEELQEIFSVVSPHLAHYMEVFAFTKSNTWTADADAMFRDTLTSYFQMYKVQKLENRILPEFLEQVNQYAESRPFYKLQSRSRILQKLPKDETEIYFFDALGVEFLSYIRAICKEFDLVMDVAIGHCELPSITRCNKEFMDMFPAKHIHKIDALDELKHHSTVYDYEKTKLPLHLFQELNIIRKELKQIQTALYMGTIKDAVIVSDHGASRLAVLYGQNVAAAISMEESGEHSGRCCQLQEDPKLSHTTYTNGYAVLADYERFRGGRRANVEVHGGATLEETVVPVITISKKPDSLFAEFQNKEIERGAKSKPELILYTNILLDEPILVVDDTPVPGEFMEDRKHIKFVMEQFRRKGTYQAELYDGSKRLNVMLEFSIKKKTMERDLF